MVRSGHSVPLLEATLVPVTRAALLALAMLATQWAAPAARAQSAAATGQVEPGNNRPLRIASWNLGWHVSNEELPAWIAVCNRRYLRNAATGIWEVSEADGATVGWQVTERRAKLQGVDLTRMPPCAVYQDGRRQGVAVTPAAWARRNSQIQTIITTRLAADVYAFQEVSGVAAVRQALGSVANDYHVCSFDGQYKVQRLAFAWKKSLGAAAEPCQVVHDLSLPSLPIDDQVRPGLTLGLRLQGRLIRFLTVHLKSACVSSLDRGLLDGDDPASPCSILHQQVAPLEAAFERLGAGAVPFVALGDFNRNLWHEEREVAGSDAVRSDGTRNLKGPRAASVRTRNLWKEINDGEPPDSRAVLLALRCEGASAELCEAGKQRLLDRKEVRELGSPELMGCRNPIGLDQAMVSESLARSVQSAQKLPIGRFGGTLAARPPSHPEPALAVSDHCPTLITLTLK